MTRAWWLLMLTLLGASLLGAGSGFLWRAELALYDALVPRGRASADLVIIAIDDASLSALGRWPWRRSVHARLLERLKGAGATAVALDLVLTEADADHPEDDEALAAALRVGVPVVLPLLADMSASKASAILPLPAFAAAASRIGHADIELDRDGIARSTFLLEGPGSARYPALALALLEAAGQAPETLPGRRHPAPGRSSDAWVRDYQVLIPFIGPAQSFPQYSYADVLDGRVPDSALKGKLIMVGMTAQGAGDALPTPLSGFGRAMPGVQINADIAQALRSEALLRPAPLLLVLLGALIPIVLAWVGFLRLSPRYGLGLVLLLALLTMGSSLFLLHIARLWMPIAAPLCCLALSYPLWSWQRLESMLRFLDRELAILTEERLPLIGPAPFLTNRALDRIEMRMARMRFASARLRELRTLLGDIVSALPDATLVLDEHGAVILANEASRRLAGVAPGEPLTGPLATHIANLIGCEPAGVAHQKTIEVRCGEPVRALLLRLIPFTCQGGQGSLVSIVDISALKAAEREREDLGRFLSHDLKSPASSLMGLAQLQRDPSRALPGAELADRLDGLAQRMLDLLDSFIALAHAESADPTVFSELDLRDVLQDASDEVWALAHSRHILINLSYPQAPVLVRGDRSLLARAVVNLLSNAIKYSPDNSAVSLSCQREGEYAQVRVLDQGRGVSKAMEARLFQRFSREAGSIREWPAGAGLGLAQVRVVAEKHAGAARFVRETEGSRFEFELPLTLALGGSEAIGA